jgi:hypothetical protein
MHNNLILVFFVIIILAVIALIAYGFAQARKRTAALQVAAQEIGFTFEGDDWINSTLTPMLGTALFKRGSGGRFSNIMTGSFTGLKTSLFDYSYTISTGKSASTITQTVAAYTQGRSLPLFEMRPEGFLDRIGDAFVHNDIDFDSNPEFSRRYLLRGPEPEKIRALFTPALLTFFEGFNTEDKWHIEGNGNSLLLYRSAVIVDAEQIISFRDQTAAMAQSFFKSCGAITV